VIDGRPRPDHGDGWHERVCPTCQATWVGHITDGDWCPWCERRAASDHEAARRSLLSPTHLYTDQGNTRYDELTPIDRAVWDTTRGRRHGEGSVVAWVARLGQAVAQGWITDTEAHNAIRKTTRR
jgi:hypothetical protein